MVFQTTDAGGNEEYVRYVGIEEDDLSDGVEREGMTVRDTR